VSAPQVKFAREIIQGMAGKDVIAHKRAISRARPDLYQWTAFTDYAGDFFMDAVVKWKISKGLGRERVLGGRAHESLERTHRQGSATEWAFDARAIQLAQEHWDVYTKTPEQLARETIVAAAAYWYSHRYQIAYSQYRPFQRGRPPWVPSRWDCSGFVTCCYEAGNAPDPNGRGYDGLGYTGTLMERGTTVSRYNLKPGDLVFYGSSLGKPGFPAGSPTHVALYAGDGAVYSQGSFPMGFYPVAYRTINHCRTYDVTK
jgi:hypothetical protein